MKELPLLLSGFLVRSTLAGEKTHTMRPMQAQPDLSQPWYPLPYSKRSRAYDGEAHFRRGVVADFAPWKVGDRLWVRETWRTVGWAPERQWQLAYQASPDAPPTELIEAPEGWEEPLANIQRKWVPSIHMPRWASRLSLDVLGIEARRVQDTTEAQARCEGLPRNWTDGEPGWSLEEHGYLTPAGLHANESGDDSPECWVWWKGRREIGVVYTACEALQIWWDHIYGVGSWAANGWVWGVDFRPVQVLLGAGCS